MKRLFLVLAVGASFFVSASEAEAGWLFRAKKSRYRSTCSSCNGGGYVSHCGPNGCYR